MAAAGKEGDRMLHSFVHFVSLVRNKEKNMDEYEHFLCVLTIVLFILLLVRSLVALYMGRWNLFTDI